MVNPLHLLNFRTRRVPTRRRRDVPIPTAQPSTDAIFLVLRRMRWPFVLVVVVFSIATAGMTLIPGVDDQGNLYYMTFFDSFYHMSITLTTVGFSETPYMFSYPQRMWITFSIFMLVISWAYAIGVMFAMLQEPSFQDAWAMQRFRRKVARMREPFLLLAGYGQTGRSVGMELDERRKRFVVLDHDRARIDLLETDQLTADVPALEADARIPAVLGLAGLGHPDCSGVLALTDDDEVNLAVVMCVSALRPDVPVVVRCTNRRIQARIEDFSPRALINPDDRYGGYLALALLRPVTYQLLQWLMDNDEHELPELRAGLREGRWLICGDGAFAEQVTADLSASGLDVEQVGADSEPDLSDVVGFVAGTDNDTTNIALAERASLANPAAYVCVRQATNANLPLLRALDIDSIYVATDLVARELLARVLTPRFFSFVESVVEGDEEQAVRLRDELLQRCGRAVPEREVLTINAAEAPAVARWLTRHELTIGNLLRHPDDREVQLAALPLLLIRDGVKTLAPDPETALAVGDQLLLAGSPHGLADLRDALFYVSTVEYLATGQVVPQTWVWRRITHRRRRAQHAG